MNELNMLAKQGYKVHSQRFIVELCIFFSKSPAHLVVIVP